MRQLTKLFLLLLALTLLSGNKAFANDYCSVDFALRVCNLDGGTLDQQYATGTGESADLNFELQSCKWQSNKSACHPSNFLAYLVSITADNDGTNFLLTGPGNVTLPVSITYTDATNFSAAIPADGSEVEMNGTNTLQAVAITVTVDPLATQGLAPGTYSAPFTFSARQTGGCGSSGCTEFNDIAFTVNVTIPSQIVVRRLNDIPLTRPSSASQPIFQREDICVGGTGFSEYNVSFLSENGTTGTGGGSYPFQLNGSNTADVMPYEVAFAGSVSAGSGTSAASDGTVPGTFTRTTDLSCNLDNATIFITVQASDWTSAVDTQYTDTLHITVTPE
ncbi:hypothetical protein KUV22_08715 [Microbulbifer agarilyticus]|uniref:hypothetical protein n=1 Tax=Microbulbifer agarilyticus TaxID=260552 RepID=UPI001C95922F|nr:hypothetical protein [Microbulbifer agarilyticus]MBY6190495.1 hypothetical protein [Microbulbifer agarilyticus]